MRHGFALAALLVTLSGCYLPPAGYGYGQPGYPPPGPQAVYAQPGYPPPAYQPGYAAAPVDAYGNVYPGYSYNDGAPTLLVEGAPLPLIFFDGGWGYYDRDHGWHRAPDVVGRNLEQRRLSGATFRNGGGRGDFQQRRPEAPNPGQAQFRPAGQPHYQPAGQPQFRREGEPRPAAAVRQEPARTERRRDCQPGQRC